MAGPNTMTLELPEDIPDKFKHTYVTRRLDYSNDELDNPNPEFDELLSLMTQNEEFSKWLGKVGMYLEMLHLSRFKYIDTSKPDANYIHWKCRNTEHITLNYKYISSAVDLSADAFEMAIKRNNYIKDERWLNAIVEIYEEFLFNRKREPLTRAKLLQIVGKTENDIKDGVSVTQMIPFFDKYNIPVKVFDVNYKFIFRHHQNNINKRIKPLYVLMKNNHIYVLNHDLKRLEQKLKEDYGIKISASENYSINDKANYNTFKMIESIDDVIKILKDYIAEHGDDKKKDETIMFNCIYRTNNLEKLLFDIIDARYQPQIKFQAGAIQSISIKLKGKYTFLIRNQNLLPDSYDGSIEVDHETEYNNMYKAQGEFHDALFNSAHKSYSSKFDIDILDEYRTVAQAGQSKQLDQK